MTAPTEAQARAISTQDQLREFIGKHGQEDTATFLLIEADAAISALCASLAAQPAPAPDAVPVGEVYRAHAGGRTRSIGFDAARLYEGANVAPGTKLYAGAAPVAKVAEPQPAPDHWSDCATNNAPAYKPGPCDCLPTPAMCRAAVVYANGADVYKRVPAEALAIEEGIYAEVWKAMQAAHPQHPAPQPLTDAQIAEIRQVADALQASADYNSSMAEYSHSNEYRAVALLREFAGISAAQVAPADDKTAPTVQTDPQNVRHELMALARRAVITDRDRILIGAAIGHIGAAPQARLTPLADSEVDAAAKELDDDIDFLAGFQRGVEFAEFRHGITATPAPTTGEG